MRQGIRAGVGALCLALMLGAVGVAPASAATWTIVASPKPRRAAQSELNGMACTSATNCMAVGEYGFSATYWGGGRTLIERWNGTAWRVLTSPNPSGAAENVLYSVSCPTATSCTAVGVSKYLSSSGFTYKTLVERWNGTAWTISPSPNPSGAWASLLGAVSCTSATNCTAVGYSDDGVNAPTTLVERWNGTAWTVVASPNPSGATLSVLGGVSCTAATNCTAVGSARFDTGRERYDTLVEQWNGTAWSIVASPNAASAQTNELHAVTCTAANNCTAVGTFFQTTTTGTTQMTLVEQWNGTAWTIVASPNPSGATASGLSGVSCTTASNCTAVGRYISTTQKMLIERSS